jgi:hypothetical protein
MSGRRDTVMGRREFLGDAARSSVAAGLVAAGALLVLCPHGSAADCVRPVACGSCDKFEGCGLPKAERARERDGGGDA